MIWLTDPDRDDEVREFIQGRVKLLTPITLTTVMGFERDKEIVGGVLFERYTGPGGSIVAHWAFDKGTLTFSALQLIALYVFHQIGCEQLIGEVRASDEYVITVDKKIGFEEVARIPGYFPDDDLVILTLARADCRFLSEELRYGKEVVTASGT